VFSNLAIAAWYYASLPYRWCANAAAARAHRSAVMVLFYHRVADCDLTEWTITNDLFREQIDYLQANFDLISLPEAQRRIVEGNVRPAVAITFDDGYAENCERALPLLIERRVPVTYFVTTHYVRTGEPFPHDLTRGAPFRPNTIAEIRDLAAAGIEIGAHTRTHPDLGPIADPARIADEVLGGRDELADWLGRPIRYFAFPFGQHANMRPEVFRLCREAGMAGVASAYGGYNFPGDDPFHLQRIHGDPDMLRIANSLSVDPRKQWLTRRYDYRTPANAAQSMGVAT
jgi:peptidoglycan/xylan/chitin deacetylase (PgdA/CDA1 family)